MGLSYGEIKRALAGEALPAAFVDLDAFDRNVERVLGTIEGRLRVRPASKSLRVVSLLKRVLAHPSGRFQGAMCFAAREAVHLASHGVDDLLLAYPPFQQADLDALARLSAQGTQLSVVVDSGAAVLRLGQAARAHGTSIRVVLCADMSLKLLRGSLHLGVRRSPLHSPQAVVAMAKRVADTPGLSFHGLMGYEAQVAGLGDQNPFEPAMNPLKTLLKKVSMAELGKRRAEMVAALKRAGLPAALVNGGGSGSLDSTTAETGVTELTAGSAFLKSHLFDYYKNPHMRALEPAAFFALEITRKPSARENSRLAEPARRPQDYVTCLGGGYVASGPPTPDKAPLPHLPLGLKLISAEMAGEVQTPLLVPPGLCLDYGDPVIFRHAKAGELAERFNEYLLLSGGEIVDRVPTYRGEGQCFL